MYGNRLYGSKASIIVDKGYYGRLVVEVYMRSVLRGSIGVLEGVVLMVVLWGSRVQGMVYIHTPPYSSTIEMI